MADPGSTHDGVWQRPADPTSLSRWRQRLTAQPQAPWLHAEVARRMGERLSWILRKPDAIIDWEARAGASSEVLRGIYPQARRVPVTWQGGEPRLLAPVVGGGDARRRAWHHRMAGWLGLAPRDDAPGEASSAMPGGDAPPQGAAGLVWANMALHAHVDPLLVMRQWHRLLAVDGFLMCSTFGPGSLPELQSIYRDEGWSAPMAPLVDMHDLGDMLVQAGFADPVMDQETLVLTWDTPQAALAELRGLGLNAARDRFPGLRTPRWRDRLLSRLMELASSRPDGRIGLSFEVAYGHAFKPAPRVPIQPEVSLDLQAMRAMLQVPARVQPGGAQRSGPT